MNSITMSAFADEMQKIAIGLQQALKLEKLMGRPSASKMFHSISRRSGEMGAKAIPKHVPMTAYIRGGKVIKQPVSMPPPLPKMASAGEGPVKIPVGKVEKWKAFKSGIRGEAGPAAGATLGAGLASMYGVNPLAGAAAGYGVGALPDIIAGIAHRIKR